MDEFRAEVEENPVSLSSMKWYAFGWLLYVSMKVASFFVAIKKRASRGHGRGSGGRSERR